MEGAGVPPSRSEGARWLERAANQGYVEAQAQLATLAIHGLIAHPDAGPAARLFASPENSQPDFEAGLREMRVQFATWCVLRAYDPEETQAG